MAQVGTAGHELAPVGNIWCRIGGGIDSFEGPRALTYDVGDMQPSHVGQLRLQHNIKYVHVQHQEWSVANDFRILLLILEDEDCLRHGKHFSPFVQDGTLGEAHVMANSSGITQDRKVEEIV